MPTAQVLFSRRMYDARSATYDKSWHPLHAAKYIQWARPQPGQHILDLACGTGLITLLAKQAVGPTGTVTGVDISTSMLSVAKEKAELNVDWLDWDISDLDHARAQGKVRNDYDLIMCATALVLLQDPPKAIAQWASLLKPGGRMITDVPTESTQMEGFAFEEVGKQLGIEVPFCRSWASGPRCLKQRFLEAGLEIEDAWRAEGYNGGRAYQAGAAGERFDEMVEHEAWAAFREDGVRPRARKVFIDFYEARKGEDGMVREEDAFYVAIGRKP